MSSDTGLEQSPVRGRLGEGGRERARAREGEGRATGQGREEERATVREDEGCVLYRGED